MRSLSEISKKLDEQDRIRAQNIRKPPKYEHGFEEEERDGTKCFVNDKEFMGMFLKRQ